MCAAQMKGERAQALVQVGKGILMANQKLGLVEERSVQDDSKKDAGNTATTPSSKDSEPKNLGSAPNQEASQSSGSDLVGNVENQQGSLLSVDVCSLFMGVNATQVHRAMTCPKQCPYSQIMAEDRCKKICVAHCAYGDSPTSEGVCAGSTRGIQWWINVLIVSTSLIIATYLVSVTSRTLPKSTRVQLALEYELQPDDCSSTLALHEAVSGIGTILYLRWVIFLLAMAALCFSVSYASLNFPLHSQHSVGHEIPVYNFECPPWPPITAVNETTILTQKEAYVTHAMVGLAGTGHSTNVFHSVALSYILVVICSLVFSALQIQKACTWIQANPTHKSFAVHVSGLPSDISEPERLKALFQDVLDSHQALTCAQSHTGFTQAEDVLRVVGVSVAYNYQKSQQLVDSMMDTWQEELSEDKTRSVFGEPSKPSIPSYFCRSLWAERLDSQAFASPVAELEKDIRATLPSLSGSGRCIVVLSSDAAVRMLIMCINTKVEGSGSAFFDLKPLTATAMQCEPLDIAWDAFEHEDSMACGCVCSSLAMLGVIGVWSVLYCKHLPGALFSGHLPLFIPISGGDTSWILKDVCLSVLIAIGNTCVMSTLQRVCKCFKFNDDEQRGIIVLSLGFLATFLNAFGDLFVLLTGMQLLAPTWKFEDAIVLEVSSFVLPGYLILPSMARLISKLIVPSWLSRASTEFSISQGYAELLTNFSIALGMLVFATRDSWTLSLSLMIFLGLMYTADISKLLSSNRQTFYSSTRLSDIFAFWWSVPTGCLGAVAIWWAAKAGHLQLEHVGFPKEMICAAWIPLHVSLYIMLLLLVRRCCKGPDLSKWKYEDAAATWSKRGIGWDYFNTNPIFCLRSRFLHAQPCIPYVRAKQSKTTKPPKLSEEL
jgi:hypothetical protein